MSLQAFKAFEVANAEAVIGGATVSWVGYNENGESIYDVADENGNDIPDLCGLEDNGQDVNVGDEFIGGGGNNPPAGRR